MGNTFRIDYHMIGEGSVPLASDESGQPFVRTVTAATGTPTFAYLGDIANAVGVMSMGLEATSSVQNVCVSFGDVLALDALMLKYVEFRARLSVALGATATTMVAFGLASERNDAIDTIAEAALFRVLGDAAGAVIVESDDGVTNNDDIANGKSIVLGTTFKRFGIDFQKGLADVRFFADDADGRFVRIAEATTFDMSGLIAGEGLQFYAQIQKAANTELGTLQIDRFSVDFKEV